MRYCVNALIFMRERIDKQYDQLYINIVIKKMSSRVPVIRVTHFKNYSYTNGHLLRNEK